ncbi:HGGxSTG domain-containing protein [Erythrobacter sp.]|uniref:HGGxSTG domain-containing protein n=1 Tax=Erythrobacter sp. TaxID=1042 RepID=UPI003457825E
MRHSPRCSAKTRKGTPCQSPAVKGKKKRCRMHGSAKGSGAPLGNQNAFKHGEYSHEVKEFPRQVRHLLRSGQEMLDDF